MLAEGERYRRDLLNTAIAELRPEFFRELKPEIQMRSIAWILRVYKSSG